MRAFSVIPVLVAAACCSRGAEQPAPPDRGMPAAAAAAVPIENFARVDEGLYRGAQPDAAGFRALRELGVKTVVNLRYLHTDSDDPATDVGASGAEGTAPEGLTLVEIPLHALLDSDPPTDEDLKAFFDVVLDPARRPVYVHCAHGKDRTGTMCAVYRMEIQGWTPERAFEEMQQFGFHDMYVDLEKYVKSYVPRGFGKR
jgi:protein tyrosine/serine phosphatase